MTNPNPIDRAVAELRSSRAALAAEIDTIDRAISALSRARYEQIAQRRLSAAGRRNISSAAKQRWAQYRELRAAGLTAAEAHAHQRGQS